MTTTFHTKKGPANGHQTIVVTNETDCNDGDAPSLVVKGAKRQPRCLRTNRGRTAKPHGIDGPEYRRLSEGTHAIASRGPAIFVSLAGRSENDATRVLADKLKNHIRTFNRRNYAPAFWVEIWETKPGPHFHLIAAAPRRMREALCRSVNASRLLGDLLATPVWSMTGLVPGYFREEATPQAWHGAGRNFRRRKGSHRLPGGGDRVRLSPELAAELRLAGLLEPYRRTNARRAIGTVDAAALDREYERARIGLFYADELPLTAVSAGSRAPPRKRSKAEQPSLPLNYPPTVVDMLPRLGMTHEAIAECLGLSRQQVTNVIGGRFGISRRAAQRILKLARAA
jgi:hypothetical protein